MKFYAVICCLILLSGCAVGPLVSHETARTVGDANHELAGGYGMAGLAFKWNYGVTENLDIGFHYETLSMGVRAKYAFLNNSAGWSLASALGAGASVGGSHYYADLMASYLVGSFEPYGTLRLVDVTLDPLEFQDTETGAVDFTIASYKYQYGQFIFGTRYWFNQNWHLSAEASNLFSISLVSFGNALLFSAAIGYRF